MSVTVQILTERRAELREAAEWLLAKLDDPLSTHLTLCRAYRLVHNTGLRWDRAVVEFAAQQRQVPHE